MAASYGGPRRARVYCRPGPLSIPPEVPEPRRRQLRIAHRVPDAFVAKVSLERACIGAFIRELVAASMAEHVGMGLERQLGLLASALHQPIEAIGRERAAALAGEHKRSGRVPAQLA